MTLTTAAPLEGLVPHAETARQGLEELTETTFVSLDWPALSDR